MAASCARRQVPVTYITFRDEGHGFARPENQIVAVHEWRASHPIGNFALSRIRMFTASVVSLLVLGTTNSVLGFLLPFYMQSVLGLSPSFIGLVFLGAPATMVCVSLSGPASSCLPPSVTTPASPACRQHRTSRPFVASINATYLACAALVGLALAVSFTRGRARIEAAPRLD